MDTAQSQQPATKIHRLTRRHSIVLLLTLFIAASLQLSAQGAILGTTRNLLIWTTINLSALALLWFLAYRYINFTAALVAGIMYAVSPWANEDTSGFVGALLLIALGISLYSFTIQIRWITLKYVPLLLFPLIWGLWLLFAGTFSSNSDSSISTLFLNAIIYMVQLAAGLNADVKFMIGLYIRDWLAIVPAPTEIWLLALGGALLLGFPALWWRSKLIFALIILWITLPILILTIFIAIWRIDVSQEFFVPALPALCLLAGAGVAWLIKLLPGKPYSRMIVLSAYGAIFLSQALWWRGVLRYLANGS